MRTDNWKILKPIKVGNKIVKNRIVMAPMETVHNNPDGSVNQDMIDYFIERARGGTGMIIVGNSNIDNKGSRSMYGMLRADSGHMIASFSKLAEAIKLNGAVAICQLGHGGRQSNPECILGEYVVAPSAIPSDAVGVMPKELTIEEIAEIEDAWANAARRMKMAGFDGVEIHSAHGYLMGEFISPKTNLRKDKYGGSLARRAIFALEVVTKVRAMVGKDFIMGFRLSGEEFVPSGLTIDEGAQYARMIADTGAVDYIHVSAATYESRPHLFPVMYYEHGHLVPLAARVKQLAKNVPVITVGALDAVTAEKALEAGKADMAAFGRPLLADPEIANKIKAGNVEDIRPCLLSNEGCVSRLFNGLPCRCEVNPAVGRESYWKLTPAAMKKKVMVIGGGIAGMEAARIAAIRGHDVTLVEKGDHLGGHLIEASAPKFKGTVRELLNWVTRQVSKGNIKMQLKTEATPSLVKQTKPDVLIVAVGSGFVLPDVPGKNKSCIVGVPDVLMGKRELGAKVVVIGGGIIGCETALHIAEEMKKRVTVIEMLDDILCDQEVVNRSVLIERLQAAGVEIRTGWMLREIRDKAVVCEDKNRQMNELAADSVIVCTGLKARKELVDKFKGLAPQVYAIGDCVEARKIYNAFEDAWRAIFDI
ncbi:FAD-dependent oxidoreductase [Chloroflexota bacterium]